MGDVCVQTLPGEHVPLPEPTVQAWQRCLRGPVLRSGHDGYEEARQVWNGMIDRKPALIVRCMGVADVIAAVKFAASTASWWPCVVVGTMSPGRPSATVGW